MVRQTTLGWKFIQKMRQMSFFDELTEPEIKYIAGELEKVYTYWVRDNGAQTHYRERERDYDY